MASISALIMLVFVSAASLPAEQRPGMPFATVVTRQSAQHTGNALAIMKEDTSLRGSVGDSQDGIRIDGPSLGFLFDPVERSIRPMRGLPGAATLREPLILGFEISWAAVSPGQDYALIEVVGEPELALIALDMDTPQRTAIPLLTTRADRVVFSPGGGSVLLYFRDRGKIQVLRGLPLHLTAAAEVDVSALPETITDLAISDDGEAILAQVSRHLLLLTAEGDSRYVTSLSGPSAIVFLHRSRDALIADRGLNNVSLLRDVTGAMQMSILATERDEIQGSVALGVSRDNQRAFIANLGSGTIRIVELSSGLTTSLSCGCSITGLPLLNGNAVFRLTGPSQEFTVLLDGDAPEPRTVLVPAPQPGLFSVPAAGIPEVN